MKTYSHKESTVNKYLYSVTFSSDVIDDEEDDVSNESSQKHLSFTLQFPLRWRLLDELLSAIGEIAIDLRFKFDEQILMTAASSLTPRGRNGKENYTARFY